jgi:hypothetical protein
LPSGTPPDKTKPSSDKGKTRKVILEDVHDAVRKVLPKPTAILLVQVAFKIRRFRKMLVPIIDNARCFKMRNIETAIPFLLVFGVI